MKIFKDLKACSGGSFFKVIYHLFLNSDFHLVFWFRVAHFFGKIHLTLVSKIIMFFHKLFYTVDIDYRAKIAGGFRVAHGMCIVIGRYVVIEENVTIYQGVTLGGNSGKTREIMGEQRSQPYIHKNATLYTGCSVFGPCEIGENSVIGAHTVITKDVDANTIVHTSNEIVVTEVKTKEQ